MSEATLRAAISLFNDGRYLAAHELFDELWEAGEGDDAPFYKGLVQASVCLHHLEEGNVDGALKLYRGHRRSLASFLPAHAGIDVQGLLGDMQSFLGPVLRREPSPELDPEARPRIARRPD